jgi:hypothetical protein
MRSSAIRTFTVQGTGSGTIMGTASVPTVRFTPTSTAAASANVTFAWNGDTRSRLVTGTGTTASDTTAPLCRKHRHGDGPRVNVQAGTWMNALMAEGQLTQGMTILKETQVQPG